MNPQTLQAFQKEMRKLASESEKKVLRPSKKDEELAENAQMGIMGGALGAYGVSLALLKSPFQPGTPAAMEGYVKRIAKEMKLPEGVTISTPSSLSRHGFRPAYYPLDKRVVIPLNVRDAVISHELGHAKNDLLAAKIGAKFRIPYQVLETMSRIGSALTVVPMMGVAAADKEMSYTPGIIQAIISSPMITEEAVASARATAHLIRTHGTGQGIVKALPLIPAFATYAAIGGAPLLVTYLRRRAAMKEAANKGHVKEKVSKKKDDEGLNFFERHPKKILGGAALATAGGYLLSRGKKKPAVHFPVATKAPHVSKTQATAAASKPLAKKLTHDEARALGYPGAGPKSPANQNEKHLGAGFIQASREHGMRAGMPTEEHRKVTTTQHVANWLRRNRKGSPT